MKKFELCFELEGRNEYIIAELLAAERPEFGWDYDNGLYSESGVMPMQFGEDPDDKTWCWEATRHLCEYFGLDILEIKDERHFLELVGKVK